MERSVPRGFTLIEVLVVFTIVGMLIAITVPAIGAAKGRARTIQCTNNIRELGLAVQNYAVAKGRYPGWRVGNAAFSYGWVPQLFPYLGRTDLHRDLLANTNTSKAQWSSTRVAGVVCPADFAAQGATSLSYVANAGRQDRFTAPANLPYDWPENGVFMYRVTSGKRPIPSVTTKTFADGQGSTILLAENIDATEWTRLEEYDQNIIWVTDNSARQFNRDVGGPPQGYRTARPSSGHPGGFMVVFCDGHTQFVREDIEYEVFQLLMTPDGKKARNPGAKVSCAQSRKLLAKDFD